MTQTTWKVVRGNVTIVAFFDLAFLATLPGRTCNTDGRSDR